MILIYLLFAMLLLRFLVVVTNFFCAPYTPQKSQDKNSPLISILIPARNEEESLPDLLNDLTALNYPNTEIIICNDQSTDNTLGIIKKHLHKLPKLTVFTNEELPDGWIGKNFACHQLAQRANGDYFLFIDADVRLNPDSITKAINYISSRNTALLSIFPQQTMITKGEHKTVPIMNWILLSLLPLIAIKAPWFSSLSAANGQFMLFDGKVYRKNQWHSKVRNQNVEDILIAKMMKKARLKTEVLLGKNDVFCRMYRKSDEAINGFGRNIHQYFNGNRVWMILFVTIIWIRLPLLAATGYWTLFWLSATIILIMKCMIAYLSRQNIARNLMFHLFHLINLTRIVVRNIHFAKEQKLEWKGRIYRTN